MSSRLRTRVIPVLQLINDSLVKTVKFSKPVYIGDPVNTVRIFNELEVDELCFLDIRASSENREPNYNLLSQIANECFMPLAYGGGIKDLASAKKILSIGFEKIVVNTACQRQPDLLKKLSDHFGSQAIIASIDVKKNPWGKYHVYINNGQEKAGDDVVQYAQKLQQHGAGELILTSMDREGTWSGFDTSLVKKITDCVTIPVIANGGAGNLQHITDVVKLSHASAVGLGSMVVFQKKGMGVLVNFPDKQQLSKFLQ